MNFDDCGSPIANYLVFVKTFHYLFAPFTLKDRLVALKQFPFMYYFELNDLLFFIPNLQNPPMNFSMLSYVSFSSASTQSAAHGKLTHAKFSSKLNHFHYFNHLPRLWNSLPSINLSESFPAIKSKIKFTLVNISS